MFLVYDNTTGKAVSYGTVLTDPMPDTYTVRALTDDEADGVTTGRLIWNPATFAFDINPHQQNGAAQGQP